MVDHVPRGVASKVGVVRRYATFPPFQCRIAYFRSFILSHFMYAASAYLPFLTAYQSGRLNEFFKRAVRTVCRVPPGTPTSNILTFMNIQTLTTYANIHLLVFIWHCLHDSSNISMLFAKFFSRSNSTQTRCWHSNLLIVPASPTAYLDESVTYAGSTLWNQLPDAVRQERKRNRFKSMALAFLLTR